MFLRKAMLAFMFTQTQHLRSNKMGTIVGYMKKKNVDNTANSKESKALLKKNEALTAQVEKSKIALQEQGESYKNLKEELNNLKEEVNTLLKVAGAESVADVVAMLEDTEKK